MAGDQIEAADGPSVVVAVDVAHQLHHFTVVSDALLRKLRIDRALDGSLVANRDRIRLQERKHASLVFPHDNGSRLGRRALRGAPGRERAAFS